MVRGVPFRDASPQALAEVISGAVAPRPRNPFKESVHRAYAAQLLKEKTA